MWTFTHYQSWKHPNYTTCKNLDEHGGIEMSPIACSAQWGEEQKVEKLAKSGADVNERDEYGLTPLMRATDVKDARILIYYGADVNALDWKGKNVLATGWYGGDGVDMFKFFLWHGADPYHQDDSGESMYAELKSEDDGPGSRADKYLQVIHDYEKRHRAVEP